MWISAKYEKDGFGLQTITAIKEDGSIWYIPENFANIDYQNIMTLVAEGKLTIAPAEAQ